MKNTERSEGDIYIYIYIYIGDKDSVSNEETTERYYSNHYQHRAAIMIYW